MLLTALHGNMQKETDTKIENTKNLLLFLSAPKMVSFSQLPAVQKDTIFGAARKVFGPF